jgi:hypothetical protein
LETLLQAAFPLSIFRRKTTARAGGATGGPVTKSDVLSILDQLSKEYRDDELVRANCDFYSCKLLIETDPALAREHILAAEQRFRTLLPPKHEVFAAIKSFLASLPV